MAKQFIKPLKITDDFYWVGVDGSSPAHLLVTDEGLVLIDTASHTNVEEFLANIASLGFDVRDVKHIIHSHGHYDHVGATSRIVKLSGAKTYIGARDADAVRGKNKRLWASLSLPENASEFYFEPDVLLYDGDVLADNEGAALIFIRYLLCAHEALQILLSTLLITIKNTIE